MNYIWELAIRAIEREIDPDTIVYQFGRPFSGYMELSFTDINETEVLKRVEINPYYRYYKIFKELFEPNFEENPDVVEVVHDLAIHHLKDIDVLMGMNKREYQIWFVVRDMLEGILGTLMRERVALFTKSERKILANNLLTLYTTGECVFLLKDTVSKIFKNAYIFTNNEERDQIILFLRTNETKEKAEKIEAITHLFLPLKCEVDVYWEHIFGIVGVDEMMKTGEMLMY